MISINLPDSFFVMQRAWSCDISFGRLTHLRVFCKPYAATCAAANMSSITRCTLKGLQGVLGF